MSEKDGLKATTRTNSHPEAAAWSSRSLHVQQLGGSVQRVQEVHQHLGGVCLESFGPHLESSNTRAQQRKPSRPSIGSTRTTTSRGESGGCTGRLTVQHVNGEALTSHSRGPAHGFGFQQMGCNKTRGSRPNYLHSCVQQRFTRWQQGRCVIGEVHAHGLKTKRSCYVHILPRPHSPSADVRGPTRFEEVHVHGPAASISRGVRGENRRCTKGFTTFQQCPSFQHSNTRRERSPTVACGCSAHGPAREEAFTSNVHTLAPEETNENLEDQAEISSNFEPGRPFSCATTFPIFREVAENIPEFDYAVDDYAFNDYVVERYVDDHIVAEHVFNSSSVHDENHFLISHPNVYSPCTEHESESVIDITCNLEIDSCSEDVSEVQLVTLGLGVIPLHEISIEPHCTNPIAGEISTCGGTFHFKEKDGLKATTRTNSHPEAAAWSSRSLHVQQLGGSVQCVQEVHQHLGGVCLERFGPHLKSSNTRAQQRKPSRPSIGSTRTTTSRGESGGCTGRLTVQHVNGEALTSHSRGPAHGFGFQQMGCSKTRGSRPNYLHSCVQQRFTRWQQGRCVIGEVHAHGLKTKRSCYVHMLPRPHSPSADVRGPTRFEEVQFTVLLPASLEGCRERIGGARRALPRSSSVHHSTQQHTEGEESNSSLWVQCTRSSKGRGFHVQ
ncbi:hypothetical protein LR48_Vigan503s003900 [Vigna angularis]|uniref:Uncharacterized protein n=1 Tax=Phaseolus angularis TaxID=3914 RepID=A0A0L9TDB3_PHAAN|nr:hypothetical protein LR48_Vigan503s003900 [Vigna angularis]